VCHVQIGGKSAMPDTLRYLLIIGGFIGAVFAAVWILANMPPKPADVVKELSNEALHKKL
jgi:hypothetical protein